MKRKLLIGMVLVMVAILLSACGIPQEEHDAVVAGRDAMLTERDTAQAEVASLQSDLDTTQVEVTSLQSDLDKAQVEVTSLQSDLDKAQGQIETLESALTVTQSQIETSESELSSALGKVSSLQGEVSTLRSDLTTAETLIAIKETEVLDQSLEPSWVVGWTNLQPINLVKQSFMPQYPVLVAVEVNIFTANWGRGGDSITMKVIGEDGQVFASESASISEGFDGWLRFNISGGGVDVPVGETVFIQLEDTGKIIFAWKYTDDVYSAGSRFFFGSSRNEDHLFRTYGRE